MGYGTDSVDSCGLCGRPVSRLTRHHLIPRSRHRKKRVKRNFTREQMQRVVLLCPACHRQVHKTFTEKELELHYNSIEALLEHADIQRFVRWIENKPHGVARKAERNSGG